MNPTYEQTESGPNDLVICGPASSSTEAGEVVSTHKITTASVKSNFGALELDFQCRQSCVSDCSCVSHCSWIVS
ncbi:hypothetical protein KKH27_03080 [bacterium]|nr:hypothetical protein [bacterium]MBU1983049.1 hypothetical protein [bacterium]